jgi:hypothetical protein
MANKQRVVFDADPVLVECLKLESERTGAPAAEICRRALRFSLRIVQAELQAARESRTQPVLIAQKAGE